MPTVYTEVEVDVSLTDFDTDDLLDELENRGALPVDAHEDAKSLVEAIWLKRRVGNHDYQAELDRLISSVLGKFV